MIALLLVPRSHACVLQSQRSPARGTAAVSLFPLKQGEGELYLLRVDADVLAAKVGSYIEPKSPAGTSGAVLNCSQSMLVCVE